MDIYFNLIPIELNYTILTYLGYFPFNIFVQTFGVNVNYEILFRSRYQILYHQIKEILKDDKIVGNRFNDYKTFIFNIMYEDLLKIIDATYGQILSNEDRENLIYSLYIGKFDPYIYIQYRSKFSSITVDMLDLTQLKREYPIFYNKLEWFPIHINTIHLLFDFVGIIKDYINEEKLETHNYHKLINLIKIEKYLDIGLIQDPLIFDDNLISSIADFRASIILVYLLINEYLHNKADVSFQENFQLNEPDPYGLDCCDYHLHYLFYDDLLKFINSNKDKLKYI